ncbi:MAG TPA: ROK family protein [Vicinamibacterales bacterium]|nr:ROK family protein [Vicinamibacterales bacterium]
MRIGVDLGGTKIEAIALANDGQELVRMRASTPRHDYTATLVAIAALVIDVERVSGSRGTVGVGIPGTISPVTGLVKNANSTWLNGRPFAEDLAEVLGRPVRLANDANCFALSEASDGAAAGADVVFGAILGTGCGGGIVVHRQVLTGPNALAGEWGHNPLPGPREGEWPGPACYCGRTGCLEGFLSGPALARDYAEHGGAPLDAAMIASADEDPIARDVLARYEERLARALSAVINFLDPDVIVLGGGLSNIERLYVNVPPLWAPFGIPAERPRTRLVRARHGDSSGVRGAAWLWPDQDGT